MLETEIDMPFPAGAEDIPTFGLTGRGIEMAAGERGIRVRLELKANRGIKQFPQYTQRRGSPLKLATRPEPESRSLFQRNDEQTVVSAGNSAQSFRHPLGILAIAGEDGRGQPVLGKMVVQGVRLAAKSPQNAAATITSPDGIWVKVQGWREVGDHAD